MELIDLSNHVVAGNLVYVICSYWEDITLNAVAVQVTHVHMFCFGKDKKKYESTQCYLLYWNKEQQKSQLQLCNFLISALCTQLFANLAQ